MLKPILSVAAAFGLLFSATGPANASETTYHCRDYTVHTDETHYSNMVVRYSTTEVEGDTYLVLLSVNYTSSVRADRVALHTKHKGSAWTLRLAVGGSTTTKNDVPRKFSREGAASLGGDRRFKLTVWDSTGKDSETSWIACG